MFGACFSSVDEREPPCSRESRDPGSADGACRLRAEGYPSIRPLSRIARQTTLRNPMLSVLAAKGSGRLSLEARTGAITLY